MIFLCWVCFVTCVSTGIFERFGVLSRDCLIFSSSLCERIFFFYQSSFVASSRSLYLARSFLCSFYEDYSKLLLEFDLIFGLFLIL